MPYDCYIMFSKTARRQKRQLLVYAVFHVLSLLNTPFSKIVLYKSKTSNKMPRFFHDENRFSIALSNYTLTYFTSSFVSFWLYMA